MCTLRGVGCHENIMIFQGIVLLEKTMENQMLLIDIANRALVPTLHCNHHQQ
uniref:Uncharacterized protein n=1 Tax=Oryza brachyantha TaxID=4533 RepID=J3M2Z3_ORYBR